MKVEIIDEYVTFKVMGGKFEDLSPELKKILSPPPQDSQQVGTTKSDKLRREE